MKYRLLICAVAAFAGSTAAAAMPVDQFLAKADALQAKGLMAMFSGDLKLLMSTIKVDAAALRTERESAKAAGRTPSYCPPGPIQLSQKEIMGAMQAVPAPQRQRTETKDALRTYLAGRFPCRA